MYKPMDEMEDQTANLVKAIEEISAHVANKANEIKKAELPGSRESRPNSYTKYIKIRHLNGKYREMYDKYIENYQTMNERSEKYRNVPYTPQELEELEKHGYVSMYCQYMWDVEMICNVESDHTFTCHSCLYNGEDDIILFDIWYLDQKQFPNAKKYREYDIIVYNGKTGLIDHSKSMHAINNRLDYEKQSLNRLKIALSLLEDGFCESNEKYHFLQCPRTLGSKTTNKPNLIDSCY
jgi:hypothetical protein